MRDVIALMGPGGRLELDRRTIEILAHLSVGLLDLADSDPDEEEPGLEDSFMDHREGFGADGPGCPVADAGGPSWREQFDQTGAPFGSHLLQGTATIGAHEDAEDDDAAEEDDHSGGNVTDEPHDGSHEDGI
jgi:hypothetical protein